MSPGVGPGGHVHPTFLRLVVILPNILGIHSCNQFFPSFTPTFKTGGEEEECITFSRKAYEIVY